MASSRVGARISARGSSGLRSASAGRVSKRFSVVIRKARVLPVPVWAWPATSPPGEGDRQRQRLDGRATVEPGGLEPGQQRGVEVELGEGDIG